MRSERKVLKEFLKIYQRDSFEGSLFLHRLDAILEETLKPGKENYSHSLVEYRNSHIVKINFSGRVNFSE